MIIDYISTFNGRLLMHEAIPFSIDNNEARTNRSQNLIVGNIVKVKVCRIRHDRQSMLKLLDR
jgi:hypothetical protein